MTGTRRALVLLTTALTLVLGPTATAQAAYTDRSPVLSATATTIKVATVQAPTGLSTLGSRCANGTLDLHLTWVKSSTPRVVSYRVRMYTNVGINWALGSTYAAATSYDADVSVRVNGRPTTYQFSLTTTTDYGWPTESTRTGALTC
jgi:hypothetical protein